MHCSRAGTPTARPDHLHEQELHTRGVALSSPSVPPQGSVYPATLNSTPGGVSLRFVPTVGTPAPVADAAEATDRSATAQESNGYTEVTASGIVVAAVDKFADAGLPAVTGNAPTAQTAKGFRLTLSKLHGNDECQRLFL